MSMNGGDKCVVTGKRTFQTKEDADTFQRANTEKYGSAAQFPYECKDCGLWHLTKLRPELQTNSGTMASGLGRLSANPVVTSATTRRAKGMTRELVRALKAQGKCRSEMAEELGISPFGVGYHLRKLQSSEGMTIPSRTSSKISAEDLDSEEAALQAQLEAVQRRKQALIEAKQLKVGLINNNSILIQKEGERMLLPFEERERLAEMLLDLELPADAAA
jgi:biotin operon repressor